MKNPRSTSKEKQINTFYYAVHPIAAQFDKQYMHNYYLYFQKSLQILARYELSPKTIQKSIRYYFQPPKAIQYFRIISESSLQFKWSLYMQKNRDNYLQQQHMQSKKANLKWCWQNYEQYQESAHWIQAIFGVVKLKFYYLFVVGQSHQSILQSIQDYYRKNSIKPSKSLQKNHNLQFVQSAQSQMGKINSLQKIAQLSHKISETSPFLLQNQSVVEQMKSGYQQNSKWTPARIVQNINSFQDRTILNNQIQSFTSLQGSPNKQDTELKSLENLKLKLTVSELQISKDIEQKIKQTYQQAASKFVDLDNILTQSKQKSQSPIVNINSLVRTRQITSSQYLNQRNQMIVSPFYSHYKYWIIVIAILIIFGTLVHLGPKKRKVKVFHDESTHVHQHVVHKNKKSKNNKKQAKNKEKNKSEKQKRKSNKKKSNKKQQSSN